ncbi:MAG: uroporphyrinogen-III C-methyltransferase [Methanophagales archaeon]|nr:uroporphyrinogen-III C-methyltransferase [Methanophagales archaeon]
MGKVYLLGVGPGDPELVSLKAYRLINEADVLLVDRLVLGVKTLIPHDKKVIDIGKTSTLHKFSQDEINELMVELAAKYEKVVRLKGGDPFVFGRGGEEAVFLREHNIEFEIVPGITSAIAVPALFSIPLTYRGLSSSVTIITGHEQEMEPTQKNNKNKTKEQKEEAVDWGAIANLTGTIVILMGVGNLTKNIEKLLDHGKDAETPVAIIEKGFTEDARIVSGTLGEIVEVAMSEDVKQPAVIVIGDVVKIRAKLLQTDTLT